MSDPVDSVAPAVSAESKRVLCIDDDPTALAMVRQVLVRAGYRVECAHDGDDARRCGDVPGLFAITTDHQMPGTDGVSFVARVRCGGYTGKIVVISASVGPMEIGVYRALRVDAILPKPVPPRELLEVLQADGQHGSWPPTTTVYGLPAQPLRGRVADRVV